MAKKKAQVSRQFKLMLAAQFALLAKLYGLLASSNLVKWKDVIPYAMLPYSENRFWTSANTAYRNFAALFLANVLEVNGLAALNFSHLGPAGLLETTLGARKP